MILERHRIQTTKIHVYTAWEIAPPWPPAHSTITSRDGRHLGKIATAALPPQLDALPAMSDDRRIKITARRIAQNVRIYQEIRRHFPELDEYPHRTILGDVEADLDYAAPNATIGIHPADFVAVLRDSRPTVDGRPWAHVMIARHNTRRPRRKTNLIEHHRPSPGAVRSLFVAMGKQCGPGRRRPMEMRTFCHGYITIHIWHPAGAAAPPAAMVDRPAEYLPSP